MCSSLYGALNTSSCKEETEEAILQHTAHVKAVEANLTLGRQGCTKPARDFDLRPAKVPGSYLDGTKHLRINLVNLDVAKRMLN